MMLHPDDNAAEVMYRFDKELAAHTKILLVLTLAVLQLRVKQSQSKDCRKSIKSKRKSFAKSAASAVVTFAIKSRK